MLIRPCLSNSTVVAPDKKNRLKLRASFFVNGIDLSLFTIASHSDKWYMNKQFSSPLVITKFSPNSERNFDGMIKRPFSSIEWWYSPINIKSPTFHHYQPLLTIILLHILIKCKGFFIFNHTKRHILCVNMCQFIVNSLILFF